MLQSFVVFFMTVVQLNERNIIIALLLLSITLMAINVKVRMKTTHRQTGGKRVYIYT